MIDTVAVAHAPEGAGNAIRMMAIADALRDQGIDAPIAGGGPGTRFLRMNGFDPFEPANIDFISHREHGSLVEGLSANTGAAVQRMRDFNAWLKRVEPDAAVVDDPFAALAAVRHGIPFFRVDHSRAAFFDAAFERANHRMFNGFSLRMGEAFFYTTLWPDQEPNGGKWRPVHPLVHEPEDMEDVDPFDVLIVPGTYSTGFDAIADTLRADGKDVTVVGEEGWSAVPAMLPYMQAADVVLCTGFSSIAEAAVAGTPCVVYPFIDCQQGVADAITDHHVPGVQVVHSNTDALAALNNPPEPHTYENGVPEVVNQITTWAAQ